MQADDTGENDYALLSRHETGYLRESLRMCTYWTAVKSSMGIFTGLQLHPRTKVGFLLGPGEVSRRPPVPKSGFFRAMIAAQLARDTVARQEPDIWDVGS